MSSETFNIKALFTWSELEKKRIASPHCDPRNVEAFKTLDSVVAKTLTVPVVQSAAQIAPLAASSTLRAASKIVGAPTVSAPKGALNATPKASLGQPLSKKTFHDDAIVKKLLQYKDHIPLSSRILRPRNPNSTS